jgi:hypothetical protein
MATIRERVNADGTCKFHAIRARVWFLGSDDVFWRSSTKSRLSVPGLARTPLSVSSRLLPASD